MGVKPSKLSIGVGGMKCLRGARGRSPAATPRGYIPISVGINGETRLYMVHTTALYDADFLELLCRSAEEYGFSNQGVLRIPYEANAFEERMIITRAAMPIAKYKRAKRRVIN